MVSPFAAGGGPVAGRGTAGDVAAGGQSGGGLDLVVRGIGPADLANLRGIDVLHRLNHPEAFLTPYSALRAGMAAVLPWSRSRRRVFVATAGTHLIGFAHFQPAMPDHRWLLVALGTTQIVADPTPIWEALLHHGVVAAGGRGVKRLYARVPGGSPVSPALRALGFVPYGTETMFLTHDARTGERDPGPGLRAQERADTWAIHQLYNAAVPRQVQYAEAFTSHRWDAQAHHGEPRSFASRGWLIESGHHVVGFVRTASRDGNHLIELVYHPDRCDVIATLIDGALARLPGPAKRVCCAVRGYQAEAASALEDRGFDPILEQELHVKYTTANVRLPAAEVVPFRLEVRDRLPKRVPSLMQGRPGDETVT